jgi:hypothetical protein
MNIIEKMYLTTDQQFKNQDDRNKIIDLGGLKKLKPQEAKLLSLNIINSIKKNKKINFSTFLVMASENFINDRSIINYQT